jgi:hypothetical protein
MDIEQRYGDARLHAGLLCASLLWLRPKTLHGRAFRDCDGDNRHGSIHILKDGSLDASLQFQSLTYVSVEHFLDQQFKIPCPWRETYVQNI